MTCGGRKLLRAGPSWRIALQIADPDYLYAAKIVIEHYGQGAASHCAKRANHLLRIGDMDGNTVWRRILAAIEELQRGRREGEAAN